jgi:hypothetical protein
VEGISVVSDCDSDAAGAEGWDVFVAEEAQDASVKETNIELVRIIRFISNFLSSLQQIV